MAALAAPSKGAKYRKGGSPLEKFEELIKEDPAEQCEFFLKSFIFVLGDDWKAVPALCTEFQKHAKSTGESETIMNHIQAADFLQHHGLTRTGLERKKEVEDIDQNNDGKISFIEYLLLHYKVMILKEYHKRLGTEPDEDLSGAGIGLTGIGPQLLDELFTLPHGLSPQLEAALEDFTNEKRARENRVKDLEARAAKGGVKGMAAKNELIILEQADQTEMNRIELTLAAAKRKANRTSGEEALNAAKKKDEDAAKADADARRAKMKARAAMFEKK